MHTASHATPEGPKNLAPTADLAPAARVTGVAAPAAVSIEKLSDDDLVERLDGSTRRENLTTLEILAHLAEIERRRLWRTLEYRSMFDYCVRRLRYSEGAASRRIRTARLITRYPYICERIRDRRLSLCVASRIARAVLEDGRTDLIEQVEGKRLDQVDAMLATHRNPSRPVRESIRLLCVERPVENTEVASPSSIDPCEKEKSRGPAEHADGDSKAEAQPKATMPSRCDVCPPTGGKRLTRVERVFRFQFGVDAGAMAKFSRVQSIAAMRAGKHVDLTDLFAVLCDTYLDRYDPVRRAEERERTRRKRRENLDGAAQRDGAVVATREEAGAKIPEARRVPQAVRDQVFLRDGGRCTFIDRGGERCTATVGLHVDHVRPFALGGKHELSNLRLLCSAHNQLMAERTFGRSTITEMAGRE